MKVDVANWRRCTATEFAGWLVAAALCVWGAHAAAPLGPSDRPEVYINGSSYIRLARPISLKQLVGISFRTCVGGELFSQRFEQYTLHVTALYEQVVVQWARPGQPRREAALPRETLDNRWHWVALRPRAAPPALLLQVDAAALPIANLTWNSELLAPGALEAGGAVLLVGNLFSGCLHEGPQLEFHAAHTTTKGNVTFGRCPLTTDQCKDRKDVLREPPTDHCYAEPCLRHGTCISRHDRYECHCTARYTGNNCEVDAGAPCAAAPCRHGGRCVEDARGDYSCVCPPDYHGTHCELEVSLDPLCVAGPCRNGGSCSVPPGADTYVCACPPGYTGRNCETDVDECSGAAGAAACLNGGRCVDAVNNFTCDCSGTGYTGVRCEVNVDECAEEHVCGHGECYDTYGGFVCACRPPYTGERCHILSACASGPCGAGGTCVEESGGAGFRCVCARGWAPPLCAEPLAAPPPAPGPAPPADPSTAPTAPSSCAELACPPHSHCRLAHSSGIPNMVTGVVISKQVLCVCDVGYYGAAGAAPNCSLASGACEAGVCLNGATCLQAADHFNCSCAPGYKGVYCEQAAGKALSDLKAPERCSQAPCLHAKTCQDLASGFRCECEAGWAGPRCDAPDPEADCRAARCPPAHECMEQPPPSPSPAAAPGAGAGAAPRWRCVPAAADSPCAGAPCNNGSCLVGEQGLAVCQCPPGVTGRFCESDIDECQKPKICNNGVCMNVPGSYQCYCKPGYTGDNCDQDVDECLSAPCKNGGTCQNLQNNYECTCMDGFEGKDCSINIDECEPSPCAAGSTCVDGVAGYSCVCVPGLTGPTCDLNIDDCESQPCQHGGRCTDGLDSYTCECAGTGYSGAACDLNIDECAPQPCRNGGTCQDDVNDYHCSCYPGYTGKNCETDINECESSPCQYGGVCLERSDASLYQRDGAQLVGPQPHMLLPDYFYQPFSYDLASGYVCVCVAGTAGARCEVNVDECASSPCVRGKCVDGVGDYRCDCFAGYEGERCEIEVDECLRYTPCVHGRCYDGPATYSCECEPGYGGRNCSVPLEGCRGAPCRNHGTCLPWLWDETAHRFNCSCAPGYYGTTCEKITTMSLSKRSYVEVNTSRDEGYELSFRFKTTLRSGLLAMGRGLTYFFLELSNGRLNLHSSLLNKWGGVFIGSNLNDTHWQKVFVTINASHLVLAANEEQTIYPISQIEAYNSSVTSFPSTRLGTAGSSYNTFTHGPNFFVGCFQDVVVNKQWVLPEDSSASATEPTTELGAFEEGGSGEEVGGGGSGGGGGGGGGSALRAELRGVLASCPRTAQCEPNPCRSGGACEDAWTSFVCSCPRPYLGDTCQYSYTAATFGHESARPRSAVRVEVGAAARRAVHAALDISMFIRTRKPTGHIFYLGSMPRYGETDDTLVSASLKGGELLVRLRFNQTPEDYTVGGTRLDNGYLHLIEVVRNATLVQVKLNGTEYFRKSISAAKQLDAQVLYLGGPPPPAAPPTPAPPAPGDAPPAPSATAAATVAALTSAAPAAPAAPAAEPQPDDADYFKGVIQDVQVSNGVNVTVVEFFPLPATLGLAVPPSFGAVSLDEAGVLRGVRSDDACASAPCRHNATCAVTWNDYQCTCTHGYKGKQCAEVEFCQLQGCPLNSHCRNIDGGYECLSNATFDGVNTTLTYQLRVPPAARARPDAPPAPTPPESLTITYRSKQGGTLFYAEEVDGDGGGSWFSVGVFRSQVSVAWRLGGALPDTRRMHRAPHVAPAPPAGTAPPAGPAPPPPSPDATDVTPPPPAAPLTPAPPPPPAARLTDDDLYTHWTTLRFTFADGMMRGAFVETDGHEEAGLAAPLDVAAWQRLVLGARLHLGGPPAPTAPTARPTIDNTTEYGYWESTEGDELLTDNVAGKYFKGCMGAVYVGSLLLPFFSEDELFKSSASALITAQPYYAMVGAGRAWGAAQGVGCVLCLEQDCARGGHCADVRSSYACACPPGYAGDYCQIDIDECVDNQCQNGATCRDEVAGYTCVCPEGFDGKLCENDIDECASEPCANGGSCTDLAGGFSCVCGAEWRGARCQLPRTRSCAHQPCAPGRGLCRDVPPDPPTGNNYTCTCFEGFEGVNCEDAFCELQPCLHGECRTDGGRAECECAPGYSGRRCEAERDECLEAGPAPCAHGGRCLDRTNGYVCDCDGTGWTGARCELDVDECAAGLVSCLPGECVNTEGGYTCLCSPGFCGINCALRDPCYELVPEGVGVMGAEEAGARNATGPCQNGARCEQRCAAAVDYQCHCVDGWGGKNCTQQAVSEGAGAGGSDGGTAATVGIVAGAALLALCAAGGALALLALQARRKRATRGTYSPSGQEYCNPRAEHVHSALKPPPEERLI